LKSFWTLDICASHFFPSHPSTRTRSGATKEQQRQSHLKASELSCKRQRGLAVAASVRRAFLPFSCQASAFDFKESRLDPKKPLTGLDYEKTPPPIRCPQPWAVLTARAAPCQVSLQFCKFRSSTIPQNPTLLQKTSTELLRSTRADLMRWSSTKTSDEEWEAFRPGESSNHECAPSHPQRYRASKHKWCPRTPGDCSNSSDSPNSSPRRKPPRSSTRDYYLYWTRFIWHNGQYRTSEWIRSMHE
jgi:hypothetical protein